MSLSLRVELDWKSKKVFDRINEAMASAIKTNNGCMLLPNIPKKSGYVCISIFDITVLAHRAAWIWSRRKFKKNLVIDHICKNRSCVNPEHLRQVTVRQNSVENSASPAAINVLKKNCYRGHALEGKNLRKEGPKRRCRKCIAIRQANYKKRKSSRREI